MLIPHLFVKSMDYGGDNDSGSLIVVNGCNKQTVLRNRLKLLHCPDRDRSTRIGKIIEDCLTNKVQFNYETIHLLFSTNIWEKNYMYILLPWRAMLNFLLILK